MKYACIVLCIVFGFEFSAGQYTNACPLTTCAYNYKQSIEEYRCYTNYNCPTNHTCCKHECFLHKICIPANMQEAELTLITTPSAEVTIDIGNPEGRVCPTTHCDNKWKEWNEEIRCYSHKNCKEYQLCCSHSCYNHKVCLDIRRMDVPSPNPEYSETCPNTKCSVQQKVTNLKFQCTDSLDCKYQYNCCKHDCFNHKICIRSNRITSVVVPPIEIGNDTSVNNNNNSQNGMEGNLQTNLPDFIIQFSSTTEYVIVENISIDDIGNGSGAGPEDDSIDDNDNDNFNTNDTVDIPTPTPSISTLSTNVKENDDNDFIIEDEDDFSISTTTQGISIAEPLRTSTLIAMEVATSHEIDKEQGSGSGSNIDNDDEVDDDDEDDINSGESINGNDFTETPQVTATLSTIISLPTITTTLNQETEIVENIDNEDFIEAITTLEPGRVETNEEVIHYISTTAPSLNSTLIVLDVTTPHEIDKEQGSGSGSNIDNDDELDDDEEDDINSGESINGNDFTETPQVNATLSTIISLPTITTTLNQETQIVENIDNEDFIEAITTLEPGRVETNEEVIHDISTAAPSLNSTLIVLDVTTPHEIDNEQGSGSGSNIDNDDEVDDDDEDDINSGESINGNDFTETPQVNATLSTIISSPTITTTLNQETEIVENIDNEDFIEAITTLEPGRVETNEEVIDDISTAAPSLNSTLIVLDVTTPHEIDNEQGSGSGSNIDNDDEVDDDDEDDINSGESINGNDFTETPQLTTGRIALPESTLNPISTVIELSTMQEFTDINGSGSGSNNDNVVDDDVNDTEGSVEDNEDVSSASGSGHTESDIYVDEGNKRVTTNRPSRSTPKLKLLDNIDIWNLCHGINCSTAKVLPRHILKLISGNANLNLLTEKEIDFVKKSLTANYYKEFDLNFSNENEEDVTETTSNEFTCPSQVLHATHLLCHGNWNCKPGYYCKRHPCYSHYVCTNKEYNIQKCPIIQEICDDSLILMELGEFICESNFHCTYSTSLLNSAKKLDKRRNREFQCCPHECLPRHQICRQIENVFEVYNEMADVMAVSFRNSGNGAVNRALLINLVFMLVAGLTYLWLYLKK